MSRDTGQDKVCDICEKATGETNELFGPWMQKSNITVHYFCLLLSTNLLQNGKDDSGILGFLLRDIRAEILAAKKRLCCYCNERGASIACKKCKDYFHLACGLRNLCLFQYSGDFSVYCPECYLLNDFQKHAKENWCDNECYICMMPLGRLYSPVNYLYGACCGNGFVHRICMQKYATTAGYYLRCIWCRSNDFRDSIRLQGIFVPNQEAQWEFPGAFRSLHRGHKQCDMDICHCPQGREYSSKSWELINCSFCGSFGVHYPACLPSGKNCLQTEFICSTCDLINLKNSSCKANNASNEPNAYDPLLCASLQNENIDIEQTNFTKERPEICNLSKGNENVIGLEKTMMDSPPLSLAPETMDVKAENSIFENNEICSNEKETDNTEPNNKPGSCSDRLRDKNTNGILNSPEFLLESDILERHDEIGIFKAINEGSDKKVKNIFQSTGINSTKNMLEKNTQKQSTECILETNENLMQMNISKCDSTIDKLNHLNINKNYEPDYQVFDTFDISEDNRILGSVKLRLDMNSDRFRGKNINEILNAQEILLDSDVLERDDSISSSDEILNAFPESNQLQSIRSVPKRHDNPTQSNYRKCNIPNDKSNDVNDNNNNEPDFQVFDTFDISEDNRILGSVKLRLDMNSDRFRGKNINEILNAQEILLDSDVLERIHGISSFDEILNTSPEPNQHLSTKSVPERHDSPTQSNYRKCNIPTDKSNDVNINNNNEPDFQIFDTFDISEDNLILGSVKLRLDMNSDRFRGKSINEILNSQEILLDSDVLERDDSIPSFV